MIPPSLSAWSELLALFAEDLRPALADLTGTLQRLIGSAPTLPQSGSGEPAGYSGLSRRGIPERILLSEWLLASELPEEFLRRAASGQLSYLELERREKQPHSSIFVLFDTGPAQAGAPRIAQLAVLLVLLQRAQQAGVALSWGILQAPELGFRPVLPSREALLPLLSHRTWMSVEKKQWGGWKIPMDAELWLVGSADLRSLPHGGPRLILEDLLHPKTLDLEVEYRPGNGPPTTLILPMPREADCLRLLTWEEPAPRKKRSCPPLLPAEAIQWSSHSGRLLVRAKNVLRIYSFSAQPDNRLEVDRLHTRDFPPGEQVIAADYHWGRLLVVTRQDDGTVWLYGMGRPDPKGRGPARWKLENPDLVGASPGGDFLLAGIAGTLYFRDRQRLFQIQPQHDGSFVVSEQRRLRHLRLLHPPTPALSHVLMNCHGLDPAAAEHWSIYGWKNGAMRIPHEVSVKSIQDLRQLGAQVEYLFEPTLAIRQVVEDLLMIAPGPTLLAQERLKMTVLSTRIGRGPFCLGGTQYDHLVPWYTRDSIELFSRNGPWTRGAVLPREADWHLPPARTPFWLKCALWGKKYDADFYFCGPDHIELWPLRAGAPTDGVSFRNQLVQAAVDPHNGWLAWLDAAGNIGVSGCQAGPMTEGAIRPLQSTRLEGQDAWFMGPPPERELPLT